MTCDECRERLQELVDDELVPRERKAIEAHLASCPTCTTEYKELAHFTTSVAKAVQPIRPSAELSGKVLTVYQESREQLKAAPAQTNPGGRPIPAWWWLVGIGALVLAGIVVLFWPGASAIVGRAKEGSSARILSFNQGTWTPESRNLLKIGQRVEAMQAGCEAVLDFGEWGEATLKAPCAIQIERLAGGTIVLQMLPQAPGTIVLRSRAAPAAGAKRLRVAFSSAWVDVHTGEQNDVTVVPLTGEGGGWTGQLKASVKTGAARLGNGSVAQTVAEGFSRTVSQTGECEPALRDE